MPTLLPVALPARCRTIDRGVSPLVRCFHLLPDTRGTRRAARLLHFGFLAEFNLRVAVLRPLLLWDLRHRLRRCLQYARIISETRFSCLTSGGPRHMVNLN